MYTASWSAYLIGMSVAVVIYYVTVYLLFFRGPKGLPVRKGTDRGLHDIRKGTELSSSDLKNQERLQSLVYDLVYELQAYIKQAGEENVGKKELVQSLHKITTKYPEIQGSLFQDGITNLMAATVEDHCAYRLSVDELAVFWRGDQA